jgi:hypothetical protein
MSSIGGEIGGKAASGLNPNQQQYPFFQSSGGITPEQGALSEYDYGQNLTEAAAQFEGSGQGGGPSLSSMATQAAGGANIGKALQSGSMSDTNQGAEYGAYQTGINIDQQNNENLLAENQQNLQTALTGLSAGQSAAGTAAGLAAPVPGGTDIGSLVSGGVV